MDKQQIIELKNQIRLTKLEIDKKEKELLLLCIKLHNLKHNEFYGKLH